MTLEEKLDDKVLGRKYIEQIDYSVSHTSQKALALCVTVISFACLEDQGVSSKGTIRKKSGRNKRTWRLLEKLPGVCETASENREGG